MYKLTADKQSKNETSDVYVLIVSSAVDIALSGKFLDAVSTRMIFNCPIQKIYHSCTELYRVAHLFLWLFQISDIMALSEKIVAFTNDNILRLHGTERNTNTPTIWRSLSSKEGRECHMSKIPVLRHPNFIAGVAAGGNQSHLYNITRTISYTEKNFNKNYCANPNYCAFVEFCFSCLFHVEK